MNREAIQQLRDRIAEEPSYNFDMRWWFGGHRCTYSDRLRMCGTAACLAGHTILMCGKDPVPLIEDGDISKKAACVLGISEADGYHMFSGGWSRKGLNATKEEALRYLDNCLKHDTVLCMA